jgi:hypothetical protein
MKRRSRKLLAALLAGMMLLSGSVVYAEETGSYIPAENGAVQTGEEAEEQTPEETESRSVSETEEVSEGEDSRELESGEETAPAEPRTMRMVLQEGEVQVDAGRFTIHKDGVASGVPDAPVTAGNLSETAPDLTGENLYFDHAKVNGKRVYEVGTLDEITYYSSLSGALYILGETETVDLFYVSRYPVKYTVSGAEKTAGEELVEKGASLTFRAKPSEKGKRLTVTVNGEDISGSGSIYDRATGEMLFTVENVQGAQDVIIQEEAVQSFTLTYAKDEDAVRNGEITSPASGISITPGETVTIEMKATGSRPVIYYALNMLIINGHEVATPPTDADEGTVVETMLPGGEEVRVELTSEHTLLKYNPEYTITISNVYTDLHISEANFKQSNREEIILKELTGIRNIVGWDYGKEEYVQGSVNHVFLQTKQSGNEFYFNLLPGYEDPELTVKINGSVSDAEMYFGKNKGQLHNGKPSSFTQEQYQYRFDLPNDLGDNVEVFLEAAPIEYTVEYRNDKNEDDPIGQPESGYTVEAGNKDTITITSLTPYETVKGYSPDGYIVEGDPEKKVYHSGDTVPVQDVAAQAKNGTITFVPNWVPTEELGERQITVNLYIEDPESENYLSVASYLLTVGKGKALFIPDEERGRKKIREFLTGEQAPAWESVYDTSDFVLKESGVRVVEANENSLDFHYAVKRGTLTVRFAWGTGETGPGASPDSVTEDFVIKQEYEKDISGSIPEGYMASSRTVTGTMTEEGVEKTVYLYRDEDGDGRPDAFTVTLTFNAGQDGIIDTGNNPAGEISGDRKTLTCKLVKAGAEGIEADTYPAVPSVTVTAEGKGWLGWRKADETGTDVTYGSYARQPVGADAENMTFEAKYDIADGYETVTVQYFKEQEDGTFVLFHTLERLAEVDEKITYVRGRVEGYVTPQEGSSGSLTVTEGGPNTAEVRYYLDKDGNGKPDTYTLTLSFQGTGQGSWDIGDSMWEDMEDGKDYSYDKENAVLWVFLVKENDAGFSAEKYPEAPQVKAEETWLFDSWQDEDGKAYGSGEDGDGITIGDTVLKTDRGRSYVTVYDRDENKDSIPDDEQSVTVVFRAAEHGKFEGQNKEIIEYQNLLPGFHRYPIAPQVTAEKGYVFAGWTPEYPGHVTIEEGALRKEYTAVIKEDRNGNGTADDSEASYTLTYDGNPQNGGTAEGLPADGSGYLTGETAVLDTAAAPAHSPINQTAVLFLGWSAEKTTQIYGRADAEELAKVPLLTEVTFSDRSETVYAVWGYDIEGNNVPDVKENRNLTGIAAPAPVDGIPNGTAPEQLGLPEKVTIRTTDGEEQADVAWNLDRAEYDPSAGEEQTFAVEGLVALPEGVDNRDGLSLTVTIHVTVEAAKEPEATEYTLTVVNGSGSGKYAEGTEIRIRADEIPEGMVFDRWTSPDGGTFADASSPETVFVMPGKDVTVTAVCREQDQPGTGEGTDPGEIPGEEAGNGSGTEGGAGTENGSGNGTEGGAGTGNGSGTGTEGGTENGTGSGTGDGGSGAILPDSNTNPPAAESAGQGSGSLTAEAVPGTGDNTSPMLWAVILMLSGAWLTALTVLRRMRKG